MPDATRGVDAEPNDRAQQLLRTLVECYIRDGQPVGSRTLTRESGLSLSPATIRNVIADLEEHGFVSSPHTSAGRVPTDKGYRYFVDALLRYQPPDQAEIAELKRHLDMRASDPKALVAAASQLVSGLTHLAGVVTVPRETHASLSQIEFVGLSGNRVLDDPRRQWPRGAEPGRAARPPFRAGGAAPRRRLPQRAVRRSGARRVCARASFRSCRRPASR